MNCNYWSAYLSIVINSSIVSKLSIIKQCSIAALVVKKFLELKFAYLCSMSMNMHMSIAHPTTHPICWSSLSNFSNILDKFWTEHI